MGNFSLGLSNGTVVSQECAIGQGGGGTDIGCWMGTRDTRCRKPVALLWRGDTGALATAELLYNDMLHLRGGCSDPQPSLPRRHKACAALNVREQQPRRVQAGLARATTEDKDALARHNTMNPNDLILGYCDSRPTWATLTDNLSSSDHRLVRLTSKHLS